MFEVVMPALDEAQFVNRRPAIAMVRINVKVRILYDQFFPGGTGMQTFCSGIGFERRESSAYRTMHSGIHVTQASI